MKSELLAFLSCPACQCNLKLEEKTEVVLLEHGSEEIITGKISCTAGHLFAIVRGIPRLVDARLSGFDDLHTGKKFGESWSQFHRFHPAYVRQFFDWMSPINSSFVKNKLVLDAGCGKGRHARVMAESGASIVVAVDIGDSVEVAYKNLRNFRNVHVVQGDIKALPVKPIFDIVYSTGVLHHMVNPQFGFISLWKKVNKKGTLGVWVYGKENNWWILAFVNPVRKLITSRLPSKVLRVISILVASVVYACSRFIYKPWYALRGSVEFLPPLFYEAYMQYVSNFDFEEIDHIVYDHLVAPVAYYLPREEVVAWGKSVSPAFSRIRWHNRNSWTLVVSKDANLGAELASTDGLISVS